MAAAATDSGVTLSFDEVMANDCMAFNVPPVYRGLGRKEDNPEVSPPSGCSGFAAWGTATRNGQVICGGSGDHPIAHELLVLTLPDAGNSYITRMGIPGFSSHPGMNNKGLAYVHHGAGSDGNEPQGQGILGSLLVRHTLRFAGSTDEALTMQLAYPPGSQAAGSLF